MKDLPNNPKPRDLEQAYREGFAGWLWNERDWHSFEEECAEYRALRSTDLIRGTGKGQRAMLWRSRDKYDPGAFGEESQTTRDCVSHGSRNARDVTRAVEIHIKGEAESYHKRGATEPTYGARGHGGHGMNPSTAARFERDYGFLVRQNYPDLGIDLSKYNARIGISWGSRGVPEDVKAECKKHNVGTLTFPKSTGEVRDLLANGYALHSGQSWGCSANSNRDGIAVTSDRWNHDMATIGMDDTGEIYPAKYGTVFLVANSWGAWNQRPAVWPEELLGPWPVGSFWVDEETYGHYFVGSGSIIAYGDVNGFVPKRLPDYGTPKEVLG